MIVTLLTDFGLSDHYVAAMKGVILSRCPGVEFVDISHEVTPYAVQEAAYSLSQAWAYFPPGTIHLVVVDPGVGSSRRPILAEAGGHYFVGPDNGVLTMVLDLLPEHKIRHITAERFFRQPVSSTFHGRDIFAPVAGHLAMGVPPSEFGEQIRDYVQLAVVRPERIGDRHWIGTVLKIDRFGNIVTNFDCQTFGFLSRERFQMRVGEQSVWEYRAIYSLEKSGAPFVLMGSGGFLEISINKGDAAKILGICVGSQIELRTHARG